jgi:imidazolonepropionase-like amidohydrolase
MADLLVVRGNALADVICLANVLMVMRAGKIVKREQVLAGC